MQHIGGVRRIKFREDMQEGEKKSETELTASVLKKKREKKVQNMQRLKERFSIGRNTTNVQIFEEVLFFKLLTT